MPNVFDVLLMVVFAVVLPLWSHFVSWPRHARAVDAGDPRARSRVYVRTIVEEWLLVIAAVAIFVAGRRSLDSLWLGAPVGWRAWVGPLSALTPQGITPTPDEQGAVYVLAEDVDLTLELTADWRDGDVW